MTTTLNYFKTHPLRVAKNQRDLTVGDMLTAWDTHHHPKKIPPAMGAFIHYGGVELADSLVIHQPTIAQSDLDAMAMAWRESCGVCVRQLVYYLFGIVCKEMRHGSESKCNKAFMHHPVQSEAAGLCKFISSTGSWEGALKEHKTVPLGPFLDAVEIQYRYGGWGGAFGGKKWADITLVLKQYIDGMSSAMVAADRAWSLVHNTGPIFNKGFLFKLHDEHLMAVLNAQASSSVFTLGEDFLGNYDHPIQAPFQEFVSRALAALKSVQPNYVLGAHGAKTSDGNSSGGVTHAKSYQDGKLVHETDLGPFSLYSTTERNDDA